MKNSTEGRPLQRRSRFIMRTGAAVLVAIPFVFFLARWQEMKVYKEKARPALAKLERMDAILAADPAANPQAYAQLAGEQNSGVGQINSFLQSYRDSSHATTDSFVAIEAAWTCLDAGTRILQVEQTLPFGPNRLRYAGTRQLVWYNAHAAVGRAKASL